MGRPRGTTGQAQVLTEQEFKRVIAFVKGYFDEKHQLRNISILFVSFVSAKPTPSFISIRV